MAATAFQIDFSRPLTAKEQKTFRARQGRLDGPFGQSAIRATSAFNARLGAPGRLAADGLRLRVPFSCLPQPIADEEVSDRTAPPRELRPPATRLITSQGAALRMYLTALAVAQIRTKPRHKFANELPLVGDSQALGWDDLLASGAVASGKGRTFSMARDKKSRSLRTALDNLEGAGLVHLTGDPGKRGRYDNFVLLNDVGQHNTGEPMQYAVPGPKEDCFTLPAGFVTNGWLNVLEDTEIAVVLMVACGRYGIQRLRSDFDLLPGEVAIPGEERLRRYGLHRDPFSTARKTLEWFGLLDVREIGRHLGDGKAEEGTHLHRLRMVPEAFDADGPDTVLGVLNAQLERVTTSA